MRLSVEQDQRVAQAPPGCSPARAICIGGLLATCLVCLADPPHGPEERDGEIGETTVSTWAHGRVAAFSLTHDDNRQDHILFAGPALSARGMCGTFNVNPGFPYFEQLQGEYAAMAQDGHELATHTMYHQRCLIKTPEEDPNGYYFHSLEELEQDCLTVKAILDPMQPARPTQTFCYPGGVQCEETRAVIAGHFLSARLSTSGLNVNPASPANMYLLLASYVGAGWDDTWADYDYAYDMLTSYLDGALQSGGWVIEEYHDIEWPGYSALNLQAYYDHLDDLADAVAAGQLWVAPQGDIARYIYSRDAASVTPLGTGPNRIELTVDDGLDDQLFNVPITLRTRIPRAWAPVVHVKHGGEPIESRVEIHADEVFVIYSVVADGQSITIHGRATPTGPCGEAAAVPHP